MKVIYNLGASSIKVGKAFLTVPTFDLSGVASLNLLDGFKGLKV